MAALPRCCQRSSPEIQATFSEGDYFYLMTNSLGNKATGVPFSTTGSPGISRGFPQSPFPCSISLVEYHRQDSVTGQTQRAQGLAASRKHPTAETFTGPNSPSANILGQARTFQCRWLARSYAVPGNKQPEAEIAQALI